MPDPGGLEQPKQLIVEGRDCEVFFTALLRKIGLSDVQVQNFGGNTDLRVFLQALRNMSGFADVGSLGLVRDADGNPGGAFQSICSALSGAGLSVPVGPGQLTDTQPRVSVWILPDPRTQGMLETLVLRSVAADPAMLCVDDYLVCVAQRLSAAAQPRLMDKARVQAFLASRHELRRLPGEAASAGYWPWEHAAFDEVKRFLQAL